MCRTPGWMTVDEAERAINAGLAGDLMEDYWDGRSGVVYVLCPANWGLRGKRASLPDAIFGPCVMLDQATGLCNLHQSDHKPIECRTAWCDGRRDERYRPRKAIKKEWDSDRGRSLVSRWQTLVAALPTPSGT